MLELSVSEPPTLSPQRHIEDTIEEDDDDDDNDDDKSKEVSKTDIIFQLNFKFEYIKIYKSNLIMLNYLIT